MNIRNKTLTAIVITFTALFLYLSFISFNVLLNGFNTVEDNTVTDNVSRVKDALNSKIDEMATKLYDWSQWDDSYAFMQNSNKKFVESNLTDQTFTALKINMIIFVDNNGKIVYSKNVNIDTLKQETLPSAFLSYLTKNALLLQHKDAESVTKGFIHLPNQTLLVASRPIVTSKGTGPIRGTLIFGRYFDTPLKNSISTLTHLSVDFIDVDGYLPPDLVAIQNEITFTSDVSIHALNENFTAGYTFFNNVFHKPIFIMKVTLPRPIHQQGITSIYYIFFLYGVVFFIVTIVVLLLLNRIVISKLYNLTADVIKVRSKEDPTRRITFNGHDELATLAKEINAMLETLDQSNEQIKMGEKKIQDEAREIKHKNKRLEHSEETLLNVMNDLEGTKDKIEQEKIRDETMLESIGEGLMVTDKNGFTLIVNKSARTMLGFSEDEILGKKIETIFLITNENREAILPTQTIVDTVLKTGKKQSVIYYFTKKDGIPFPAIMTTTAIILNDKIIGAISVLRDVSREREVDRMKTEFISLASHQLRTPLAATKWFSEMLLEEQESFNDDQKEYVCSIHESNERMIDLVDSLLNISRIESGRIMIEPKPTNLLELVNEVIKEINVKTQEKNITISLNITDKFPMVKVDKRMIRHVYMNLLTNAVKYSPDNSKITVNIYIKNEDVISEIKDNGYGIPQKDFEKVYTKFFRAQNIANKVTDGTGLGLYLVKSIIQSSEGKIWFESTENKGTTFWFSLPINGVKPKHGDVSLTGAI